MKAPRQIVTRWVNTITAYNFKVFHLKGKLNTGADFLSRENGLKNSTNEGFKEDDEGPFVICTAKEDAMSHGSAVAQKSSPLRSVVAHRASTRPMDRDHGAQFKAELPGPKTSEIRSLNLEVEQ